MKVVSFVLYGNKPCYLDGAIQNSFDVKNFYPDFQCWFYVDQTVPAEVINVLEGNGAFVIKRHSHNHLLDKIMCWRFEPIDYASVDVMLVRDVDSKIIPREVHMVNVWLNSSKSVMIVRDHPWQKFNLISASSFGIKKPFSLKMDDLIKAWPVDSYESNYLYDEDFLNICLYPHVYRDALVFDYFHFRKWENVIRIKFDSDYAFVSNMFISSKNTELQDKEFKRALINEIAKLKDPY